MPPPNLPWNCPNPYCEDPHNPTSVPIDGKVRCRSCGWERRVKVAEPEPVDDFPGLFQPIEEEKKPGED